MMRISKSAVAEVLCVEMSLACGSLLLPAWVLGGMTSMAQYPLSAPHGCQVCSAAEYVNI
jgi:hypothetical protein